MGGTREAAVVTWQHHSAGLGSTWHQDIAVMYFHLVNISVGSTPDPLYKFVIILGKY